MVDDGFRWMIMDVDLSNPAATQTPFSSTIHILFSRGFCACLCNDAVHIEHETVFYFTRCPNQRAIAAAAAAEAAAAAAEAVVARLEIGRSRRNSGNQSSSNSRYRQEIIINNDDVQR